MTDDASLLQDYISQRSESSFRILVERHVAMVYHTCLRQMAGDSHEAQAAAQRVFTVLVRKAPELQRHPSLAGWLHRTAQYEAHRAQRATWRRERRLRQPRTVPEMIHPQPNDRAGTDLRPVIDHALQHLSALERELLVLRYLEGRSVPDLAAQLKISEPATYKRIERSIERVRSILHQRGITSTSAAVAAVLSVQGTLAAPAGLAASVTTGALAASPTLSLVAPFLAMSTSNLVVGMAVAIALSGTAALWEWKECRSAEQSAKLAGEQAAAEADLLRAARRRLVASSPTVPRPRPPSPTSPAPLFVPGAPDAAEFLRAHPEIKSAWISKERAYYATEYAALFRSLNLSPDQARRFEDIMISSIPMASLYEYWMNFTAQALTPSQVQAGLRKVLGPQGFAAYLAYNHDTSARNIARELEASTYFSESPLTPVQAEQLRQSIAAAWPQRDPREMGDASVASEPVMVQAKTFLTPPQFAALEAIHLEADYFRAQNDTTVLATANP